MHYHPSVIVALQHERQRRLEAEAARHSLIRALRRQGRWRRRLARQPAFVRETRPSPMNAGAA